MTTQPEALRLADELEAPVGTQSTYSAMRQAAAELHRLHGLDFALRNCEQALKNMATKYMDTVDQRDVLLEALKDMLNDYPYGAMQRMSESEISAIRKALAAIASVEETK
jgi:hypothetical protein